MMTGSCPITLMWWMRASGFTPWAFRPRSFTTITPLAPSQIWLAVAAVMRPPSAMQLDARDALQRGVEADAFVDRVHRRWRGAVGQPGCHGQDLGREQRPASVAARARRWLSSA
jgi:hypothetical protein